MGTVLYTIGFAKKSLRHFIELLRGAGVESVLDVRLNNTSQLAGFAKKDDLEYILSLVNISYQHLLELAPTEELLTKFKKKEITWLEYEETYRQILQQRQAVRLWGGRVSRELRHCLLCSEHDFQHCHRRLIAEHWQAADPELEVIHLV